MSATIRVVLVDDHRLFLEGLRALLSSEPDINVVGEAASAAQAVNEARREKPDLVIMDVSMGTSSAGGDGLQATRRILEEVKGTQVLILSMHDEASVVDRALKAGARGYVLKGSAKETLCQAIRSVGAGEVFLAPGISEYVLQGYLRGDTEHADHLSDRELEVLRLIAEGNTSRESARELGIKPKTVENHRARIMDKLGIRSTAGLVRYALRIGLIE